MLVEIKEINKEEKAICTSLDIAETFEKEHKNVLRDIENIRKELSSNLSSTDISTPEFSGLFYEDSYKASNGNVS